jgi:hypothetical protein
VDRLIAERAPAYRAMADKAQPWSRAASEAGDTGIAGIIDKWAGRFADQAADLGGDIASAGGQFNLIVADAKSGVAAGPSGPDSSAARAGSRNP